MIENIEGIDTNVPIRAVMNNSTFSAYSGIGISDLRKSFELKKTKITKSNKYKNCFELSNAEYRSIFCDFGLDSSEGFYAEWDYDYNLFKYQCSDRKDSVRLHASELDEKLNGLKVIFIIYKIRIK